MVQLNQAYDKIKELDAELLAIHVECSEAGTLRTVKRNGIVFPMANDDRLQVVDKYSPTSTYLIDRRGVIRARWLDSIHDRVGPESVIEALTKLGVKDSDQVKPATTPANDAN